MHVEGYYTGMVSGCGLHVCGRIFQYLEKNYVVCVLLACFADMLLSATSVVRSNVCA